VTSLTIAVAAAVLLLVTAGAAAFTGERDDFLLVMGHLPPPRLGFRVIELGLGVTVRNEKKRNNLSPRARRDDMPSPADGS